MGDYAKKPKNYRRGRCSEFERICREEREAGETVVVVKPCQRDFPCVSDIMVLSGVEKPCANCASNIQRMRDLHGFKPEGMFWMSDQITAGQQEYVRKRMAAAEAEEAAAQLQAHEDLYGHEDRERELARHGDGCDCDQCEANRNALREL